MELLTRSQIFQNSKIHLAFSNVPCSTWKDKEDGMDYAEVEGGREVEEYGLGRDRVGEGD